MSRRRTPRRTSGRSNAGRDLLGVVLIAIAIAVVGSGLVFYKAEERARQQTDPVTLCPDAGPVTFDIVLVDQTDALNSRQIRFVSNWLEDLRREIPLDGAIQIFGFGAERASVLEPLVTLCNPGRGDAANPLVESPQRVELLWKTKFDEPLERALSQVVEQHMADTSPIMEALQSVSIVSLNRRSSRRVPRELIIISDLLHNTPEFSQYVGRTTFESFRASPYFQHVRTNLAGVVVKILYVARPGHEDIQGVKHAEFWTQYFVEQGASDVVIVRVEG